jgi:hypothetical protein
MAGVRAIEQEKEQAVREALVSFGSAKDGPRDVPSSIGSQAIMEIVGADPEREAESFEDEEKVLAGRPDAKCPPC